MWKNNVLIAPRGTSQMDTFLETRQKGFYRGFTTGLIRQTVYATSRLGLYPHIRRGLLESEVRLGLKDNSDITRASLIERASAAAVSGAVASFLSSPVDVCLVLQTTNKERVSLPAIIGSVWGASGVKGFWRGYGALGTRAAIGGASQIGVHDHILTHLRQYNARRATPFQDNWVINTASFCTSFICTVVSMPFEYARVQLSMESKKPRGVPRRYTSTFQCLGRVLREEGLATIYSAFFPFWCKYLIHISVCFFVLEYGNRELRAQKARAQGLTLVLT
ncbi:solute carrier family 25 (mitochondrial oxoglutarate transporter), member 11 [Strigomonas culicis]|nr:solute carrier family 25 (mitochondrial oxoglutarate transporter), member 11 [Strigomonas culicis]|eukprot:EPY29645.1 solute carrier family 25 (mitochondrial oxoglutarate transporter), member 11 [Strigomonas culicis]